MQSRPRQHSSALQIGDHDAGPTGRWARNDLRHELIVISL
jgi:hypothetical protein